MPGGPEGPLTLWLTDPDGYRIELVQWPTGRADRITASDFAVITHVVDPRCDRT
jgi:lactoylglutathione lyase